MVMARWEQVYGELQRKAERLGYSPPVQIGSGNSQVFEFRIGRKPVLLVAFRDLGRKPDYSMPNRLWAEGLDLVLDRYTELTKAGEKRPPAIAVVIDNIGDSYAVVTMDELLSLYLERGKKQHTPGSRQFTFQVERRDNKYFLVMPEGLPAQPLLNVNSVDSIVLLLKTLRAS
jgi:hypothetical protein